MGIKRAFTLVELLLVMSLVVILATIMTGIINPQALTGRARDARRKKDLGRIRVAFEEYYSDKDCYPVQTLVDRMMDTDNCGGNIFDPWLKPWPCDPLARTYVVIVDPSTCPKWYRIYTNLENRSDPVIPEGWYEQGVTFHILGYTVNDINYGLSSSNVDWTDLLLSADCAYNEDDHTGFDECTVMSADGISCSGAPDNMCLGPNCYAMASDCNLPNFCQVDCCGACCDDPSLCQ